MKKTVMPHSLAKALMEASMQHFDDGGAVAPGNIQGPGATHSTMMPSGAPGAGVGNGGLPSTIAGSNAINPGGTITQGVTNGVQTAVQPFINGAEGVGSQLGGLAQNLASSFTAQNGYNAELAPVEQSHYGDLIDRAATNSLNGVPDYNQNLGAQRSLAQTLIDQSNGTGPNPAQAALNNNTGTNVANTAALIASARGAASNPGLVARSAGTVGAGIQQKAVSDAATLEAQQRLAAQKQAADLYGQVGTQIQGEQGVNNSLLSTAVGGQNTQNANQISNYANAQGINSQVAQNNTNAVNKTTAGLMGGISSLGGLLWKGGKVPAHLKSVAKIYHPQKFDSGGSVAPIAIPNLANDTAVASTPSIIPGGDGGDSKSGGSSPMGGMSSLGSLAFLANKGGKIGKLHATGGKVPGRAKVPGDSPQNDVVPTMLSPDEVVLPRSVTLAADPAKKAAEFMAHLKGDDKGYGKVAKAKRTLKDRVERLEKMCAGGRV